MILGRTPAGLIKTKTDGGLRAVNCACCNTCGCDQISIPQALRELVANATIDTVTILGYSSFDFFTYVDLWIALFSNNPSQVDFFAEIGYDKTTGCLGSNYISYDGGNGIAYFGDAEICEIGQTTENGTFTINGEGEFMYYYLTGINPYSGFEYLPVPPPNLVFT
jgi:hypothetical protein